MADSSWWSDIGDSLGSIFDSSLEEDPLKKSYNALQNPTIASTGIPEFDTGITAALQSNQPIIERSSKLMQQIYEPDHLTTPQLAGQALAAFLPTLLGRAIGGNAGGVYGSKAGLLAQEGVIGAQKAQADMRRKSALNEYQAEKANFDANIKQAQGLQTAGVLLKRQDILADKNLTRSKDLADHNFENQKTLQNARLGAENDKQRPTALEVQATRELIAKAEGKTIDQVQIDPSITRTGLQDLRQTYSSLSQVGNQRGHNLSPMDVKFLDDYKAGKVKSFGDYPGLSPDTITQARGLERNAGENKRPAPEKLAMLVGDTKASNQVFDKFNNLLKTADPNIINRNFNQLFPEMNEAQLKAQLELNSRLLRSARESGVMTDKDAEVYSKYFSFSPIDTPMSVMMRINSFRENLNKNLAAKLEAYDAAGFNVSGLKSIVPQAPDPAEERLRKLEALAASRGLK